jgi:hypothetical protein
MNRVVLARRNGVSKVGDYLISDVFAACSKAIGLTYWIVESSLLSRLEAHPISTFPAERGEEGLHGGVFVAIGRPAHAHFLQTPSDSSLLFIYDAPFSPVFPRSFRILSRAFFASGIVEPIYHRKVD